MIVKDITDLLCESDLIRIIETGKKVRYTGYIGLVRYEDSNVQDCLQKKVKKIRIYTEIRDRKWREKGLEAPIKPEVAAKYNFADMQISQYYTFFV